MEVKRTSNIQLPSYAELQNILRYESKRDVDIAKQGTTYATFETIIKLLKFFDLPTEFFEDFKFEDLKDVTTYTAVVEMYNALASKVLENQNNPDLILLLDQVYDYVSEIDELQKADILFVFGSKTTVRTETAIRLYQEGYAPKIMISGRCPFYEIDKGEKSEAEILGEFALQQGVPKEDLILEKTSITMPDNVKASLNLLEHMNVPHQKIILVNSPYCQRRGYAHFNKFSSAGTELIRINTDKIAEKFSKSGWYKDENGLKTTLKEFFGLRISGLINTG